MKIIVFEGLDKSGKHSAMDYVDDVLKENGFSTHCVSFPRYETPIGQLIRDWLTDKSELNETEFEMLMYVDKLNAQTDLIQMMEQQNIDYLLLDRYTDSQLVYGSVDNDYGHLSALIDDLKKPDYTVYMNVKPEISMSRKGEHGDNDKYERDKDRLFKVRENYEELYDKRNDVFKVDANQSLTNVQRQLDIFLQVILNETN